VYGIPRPDWASDAAAVAAAASKVVVPEFKPKQGVKIETDPKVGRGVRVWHVGPGYVL
jgi:ubiquitin-activating enzyme E1